MLDFRTQMKKRMGTVLRDMNVTISATEPRNDRRILQPLGSNINCQVLFTANILNAMEGLEDIPLDANKNTQVIT